MQFTKDLCIGNRIIDSEHKNLLGIISAISRTISEKEVSVLIEAFDLMENSLCAYFVVEESIAQALDFDFNQHKFSHQLLLAKFQRVKNELVEKNGMWNKSEENDFICFMKNSLIHHIKEDGKEFKGMLNTHFYDYKPD